VVICLELGADLHLAQLMLLPLTVSCFSKVQIGFTFLVPSHRGSPGQRVIKQVCVCVAMIRAVLNICFVFALAPNSGPNNVFVFGRIVHPD